MANRFILIQNAHLFGINLQAMVVKQSEQRFIVNLWHPNHTIGFHIVGTAILDHIIDNEGIWKLMA